MREHRALFDPLALSVERLAPLVLVLCFDLRRFGNGDSLFCCGYRILLCRASAFDIEWDGRPLFLPQKHRTRLCGESLLDRAVDRRENFVGLTEAHLVFGRMHVDVHLVERHYQIDDEHRITPLHQRAAVCLRRRRFDSLVRDGAPVDYDRLQTSVVPGEFARARIAVDAITVLARLVEPDQLVGDFGGIDGIYRIFKAARSAEHRLAVYGIGDGYVGIGEYQSGDFVGDSLLFLRRFFEKSGAHGRVEKEVGHGDRRPFRRSALLDCGDRASVRGDLCAACRALRTADYLRLGDRGDRRERLASETQSRDVVEVGCGREF